MPTRQRSSWQIPASDHLRVVRSQVWEVQRRAELHGAAGPLGEIHAGLRELATAVDTLLSAEIAREAAERSKHDREALDSIQRALSAREWDSDTLSVVAEIVRRSGREIADVRDGA